MAIFNSYVKWPEDKMDKECQFCDALTLDVCWIRKKAGKILHVSRHDEGRYPRLWPLPTHKLVN
jgi:hypothetical protein